MYNRYANSHFGPKLYNYPRPNPTSTHPLLCALTLGLVLLGFPTLVTSQTLEISGIQPDYPMLRNGIPLLVDGSTVRIAGAEFRFRISPLGPDTLIRATHDGRIFTAVGSCDADGTGGFQCALIDTAGNPQNYQLTAAEGAVGVWHCVGRHSEPAFLLKQSE